MTWIECGRGWNNPRDFDLLLIWKVEMGTIMERVFFSRSQLSCMICVACILSSK